MERDARIRVPGAIALLAIALVLAIYLWSARSGILELWSPGARDSYYNLLVQGFRSGHLSVACEVPPEFARLANPYDPAASEPYRWIVNHPLHDLSYYRGKLYLYFGITPALILFWPFTALTGHPLSHQHAVTLFFSVSFVTGMGLLWAIWRRYFPGVRWGAVMFGSLAVGVAGGAPLVLARCDVYEVATSCGLACSMVALAAIWAALHATQRAATWLAVASVAYGLALGARPSLLFGAIVLLLPVAAAWRDRRPTARLLVAAFVPIAVLGCGLMVYNAMRFGNALEFGQRYQLGGHREDAMQHFGLQYLWFNVRSYVWEPARWCARSPFVRDAAPLPLPAGHVGTEHPFGVLTDVPFVWLALVLPFALRRHMQAPALRWFVAAVTLLFGLVAFTLALYNCASVRYEAEFLPHLVMLAAVGLLVLEERLRGARRWRSLGRVLAGSLLAVSLTFSVLAVLARHAEATTNAGFAQAARGEIRQAIEHYDHALAIDPECVAAHFARGVALKSEGRFREACESLQRAIDIEPGFKQAAYELGDALLHDGRALEAMVPWRRLLNENADDHRVWVGLATAFAQQGRSADAERCYREALRLRPNDEPAMQHLARLLAQERRWDEALAEYEAWLAIDPECGDAHRDFAAVLIDASDIERANAQLDQAVRIGASSAAVHCALSTLLARVGRRDAAIAECEQALRIEPSCRAARRLLHDLGVVGQQ